MSQEEASVSWAPQLTDLLRSKIARASVRLQHKTTIDSGSCTIDSGSYTIDSGSHPQLLDSGSYTIDSGSSPNSPITRALLQPKSSFQ